MSLLIKHGGVSINNIDNVGIKWKRFQSAFHWRHA